MSWGDARCTKATRALGPLQTLTDLEPDVMKSRPFEMCPVTALLGRLVLKVVCRRSEPEKAHLWSLVLGPPPRDLGSGDLRPTPPAPSGRAVSWVGAAALLGPPCSSLLCWLTPGLALPQLWATLSLSHLLYTSCTSLDDLRETLLQAPFPPFLRPIKSGNYTNAAAL